MNNDISITVTNNTLDRDLYILVFQKPETANSNEMFDTLFPVAWKVLPLSPSQTADPIIYPMQLQVSAKAYKKVWDANNRFTIKDSQLGEVWSFSRKGDFTHLNVVSNGDHETVDGLVAIRNDAPQKVDLGLAKNGSTLAIQRGVAYKDQANFKLSPKLYFMYNSNLVEGDLIRSDQSSQNFIEVDLTNLKSIDVSIETANADTGELVWSTSNRINAS